MYYSKMLCMLSNTEHGFGVSIEDAVPRNTFHLRQMHSSNVIEITGLETSGEIDADAVFTRSSRPLSIATADCLPVLVGSSSETFVAAIHAGWKGLSSGIIRNSVNAFSQAGIDLSSLKVAIGPCIMECCYEVPLQMISELQVVHGEVWSKKQPPWFFSRPVHNANSALETHGEAWLSLSKYCVLLLLAEGIKLSQIEQSTVCTYCSSLGFGSYRRRHQRSEPKNFQYSWVRSIF